MSPRSLPYLEWNYALPIAISAHFLAYWGLGLSHLALLYFGSRRPHYADVMPLSASARPLVPAHGHYRGEMRADDLSLQRVLH